VYIGQVEGELQAVLIPRKDSIEKLKNRKEEGATINIENRISKAIFLNEERMTKHHIEKNKTSIVYNTSEGKRMEGKIIGYGQSNRKDEVIFLPTKGTQYSIKTSTLEAGIKKAKEEEENQKTKKDNIPVTTIDEDEKNKMKTAASLTPSAAPSKRERIIDQFMTSKIVDKKTIKTLDID
jgi:hypothetical protein